MRLLSFLAVLVLQIWFFWPSDLRAQSLSGPSRANAQALDALLQTYAFKAFVRPRTGVPYGGTVPANLTGIQIAAMRLRSGSLRRKGYSMYKEFGIPTGIIVQPYVERVVLVYQNLGNWSGVYYPPLTGYSYLAPVLGLLAYDASNLSAINLPVMNILVSGDPITINFSDVTSVPDGARCVSFDLQGVANFSNIESGNVCSTSQQGHFSIVVESLAPSPAPPPPPPPPPGAGGGIGKKGKSRVGVIVGSVVGGVVLLALLALLLICLQRLKQRKKLEQMERAAEDAEALSMATVGSTRAPAATVTRTQPILESEYVP